MQNIPMKNYSQTLFWPILTRLDIGFVRRRFVINIGIMINTFDCVHIHLYLSCHAHNPVEHLGHSEGIREGEANQTWADRTREGRSDRRDGCKKNDHRPAIVQTQPKPTVRHLGEDERDVVFVDCFLDLKLKALLRAVRTDCGETSQAFGKLSVDWRFTDAVQTLKLTSTSSKMSKEIVMWQDYDMKYEGFDQVISSILLEWHKFT